MAKIEINPVFAIGEKVKLKSSKIVHTNRGNLENEPPFVTTIAGYDILYTKKSCRIYYILETPSSDAPTYHHFTIHGSGRKHRYNAKDLEKVE